MMKRREPCGSEGRRVPRKPSGFALMGLWFVVALLSTACIEKNIALMTGKCERAAERQQNCLIMSVLLCESNPAAFSHHQWVPGGYDPCTDPDSGNFLLYQMMCQKPGACRTGAAEETRY